MRAVAVGLAVLLAAGLARADERWERFQVLMWQDRTPVQMRGLKALGFTGAKLRATLGAVDEAGKAERDAAGLSWYLENVVVDLYSSYHRYTPGKPVNWRYDAAKALYQAGDPAAFVREPGLGDPAALAAVTERLQRLVREQSAGRPLFYNLGDEPGIADLAAAWDFDLSDGSLRGMRDWLRTQYPSLQALNAQWGTGFATWDAVVPELTDAAIRREDDNLSAWSDFKAWMDVAFARSVRAGADALHAADGGALAALEGGQVPGWGGYDYALLAPTVDVFEIYDFGDALDLALAFNPRLLTMRTSFGRGPREAHAAWHNMLHGGRGFVVWDEADDVVGADGSPGPRGAEIAALVAAMVPVAERVRQAVPDPDPVAVLYSQASFRVQWLLDRRAGDHDWAARDAEREYDDNAVRAARRIILGRLSEIGVQPRLVSGAMIGALWEEGTRVLFLPRAIALGDDEVAAIRAFRERGGTVLADTEPGLFDGHGRRRAVPPLADVPHPEAVRAIGLESEPGLLTALAALLTQAGAPPRVVLLGPDGQRATGVEARWFREPGGTLLALQAARPWGAAPVLSVSLAVPGGVADVREAGPVALGSVRLDGIEPRVLAIRP